MKNAGYIRFLLNNEHKGEGVYIRSVYGVEVFFNILLFYRIKNCDVTDAAALGIIIFLGTLNANKSSSKTS